MRSVCIVRQNRIGFVVPTLNLIATAVVHLETTKVLITYSIKAFKKNLWFEWFVLPWLHPQSA